MFEAQNGHEGKGLGCRVRRGGEHVFSSLGVDEVAVRVNRECLYVGKCSFLFPA